MFDEYLDSAKASLKVDSDRQLATKINVSAAYICKMRSGQRLPSDEVMLQLAELAQKSKEAALLDLGAMRSTSDDVKALYLNLKSKVSAVVFALFFTAVLTVPAAPAHASISAPAPAVFHNLSTVYIGGILGLVSDASHTAFSP